MNAPSGTGLRPSAFVELPLGAVRAGGWLAEQLALQAAGLTGALEEQWADVGPESAWLGGTGEAWERGPYYLDGLVPLAHLTRDPGLLAKAGHWIDSILASSGDDGQVGPRSNDDWWPRMVALKALTQHHDATGDARVIDVMSRYFWFHLAHAVDRPLRDWGRVRGADELLSIAWLYERTGEAYLLELWDVLAAQTADWGAWLQAPATGITAVWDHMTHVVNVAMGIKTPALLSLRGEVAEQLGLTDTGWDNLMREHGQVHGMFSGDEWLAGTDARRGVELCAVVEAMFSFEHITRIFGTARHADLLERLAYNLLPATMSADMTSHQYHQQANQVLATVEQRDWTQAGDDCTIFGLEPNFGCCTANLHQGWPKLVRSMWMGSRDGGLVAVAYGPSTVEQDIDGVRVTITEVTDYPFSETLTFRVSTTGAVAFPLRLRIPGWCPAPLVRLAGAEVDAVVDDGFLRIDRTWADGDIVELSLPMTVTATQQPSGGIGLSLGPVVLAYSPGEIWTRLPDTPGFGDWEVRPRRSWNAALVVDPARVAEVAAVQRMPVGSPPFGLRTGSPPFGLDGVPLKVWVPGRRVAGWRLHEGSAAPVPSGPFPSHDFDWPFPLVPYGSARLRIAEFPVAAPSALGARGLDEPPA
jgi:uncharacterized protein